MKIVCGLANGRGGKIFIGMEEDGSVSGIADYDNQLERISTGIIHSLGMAVDIQPGKNTGKWFLEITVPESHFPVSLDGRHYIFSAGECYLLSGTELQALILRRSGRHWEDLPVAGASMEDLDDVTIRNFVAESIGMGRLSSEAAKLDRTALMKYLGLTTYEGQLTNAAILLFAKTTVRTSFMAGARLIRQNKQDGPVLFQDVVEGNLFSVFTKVMELLKTKYLQCSLTGIKMILKEYPEEAVRQMLLNSVIHKDYRGGFTFLRIYDNHLYLWNPAANKEHTTMTPPKEPVSRPANPTIARLFFMAGHGELLGSGIGQIIRSCEQAELPGPNFETGCGGFSVTLRKDLLSEDLLIEYDITERQRKALEFLKKNKKMTNKSYRSLNEISKGTATNDLRGLIKKGLLAKTGVTGKGVFYVLHG